MQWQVTEFDEGLHLAVGVAYAPKPLQPFCTWGCHCPGSSPVEKARKIQTAKGILMARGEGLVVIDIDTRGMRVFTGCACHFGSLTGAESAHGVNAAVVFQGSQAHQAPYLPWKNCLQ